MKRLFKISGIVLGLILISGLIYYSTLTDRYKSHYKTKFLHTFGFVDSEWRSDIAANKAVFTTPTLVVDKIFKSMQGPAVEKYVTIDDSREELVWLNSFKTRAISEDGVTISNDFVCHSNVDFLFLDHYAKWGLTDELYRDYPRLTSMSNGIESHVFPEGFGFPIFSNEKFLLQTQVLNQNVKDSIFRVKHQLEIGYVAHSENMKPLISRAVYIQLPFKEDYKKMNPDNLPHNYCIPADKEVQEVDPVTKEKVSGFWLIPKGKTNYSAKINHQLGIKDSLSLHMVVPHLHPFSEKLELYDITENRTLYTCNVSNFSDRIGLKKTPDFKSEKGIMMYGNHEYELRLSVNNTSGEDQDMMATLFLFFYDKDMHDKILEQL